MSRMKNAWLRRVLLAMWVVGFVAIGFAPAEWLPIYLDFGAKGVNNAKVATTPGIWNGLEKTGSIADLLDSAGNPTGIEVSVTDDFNMDGTAGGNWGGTPVAWAVNLATDDNISVTGTNNFGEITFTDLTAPAYNFSVISSRAAADSIRNGTFSINGFSADNHTGQFNAGTDGWTDRKIMTWGKVAPNEEGKIVLAVSDPQAHAYLSALRMVPVPEPSSITLLTVLAVAGLLWRSRGR